MPSGSRPNIVYICSDQHSFRYTGYAGHPLVKTPNMDRIAKNGTVFAITYCGSPVCTPGRACLMTGMYSSDVGSYCNSTPWDGSHPTWGTRLSRNGYQCHATGKFDLNEFERGFIRAETIAFDDFISLGGEKGAREAGRLRLEGRDYVVNDGDILNFRFNV